VQQSGPDYFEALALRDAAAEVRLGGALRTVRRGRLRRHFELLNIAGAPTGDHHGRMLTYVTTAAGLSDDDVNPHEIVEAFDALYRLNAPRQTVALMAKPEKDRKTPNAFKFPGRWLAAIVGQIAGAFNWSADYILNELSPEEAWIYLQEIALQDHGDYEREYSLSMIGRDKKGKQKNLRDPAWFHVGYPDQQETGPPPPPIPERFRPVGKIVKL